MALSNPETMVEFQSYLARSVTMSIATVYNRETQYYRNVTMEEVQEAAARLRSHLKHDTTIKQAYSATVATHTFNRDEWEVKATILFDTDVSGTVPPLADIMTAYGQLEEFFHTDPILGGGQECWYTTFQLGDHEE